MTRSLVTATILLTALTGRVATADEVARAAGRVQSVIPADGLLLIEEVGADGRTDLLEVATRDAQVVRVWRDPHEPWQWRERPARLARLPVGTFVVVIGRQAEAGLIEAGRIEIPEVPAR